MKVVFIRFEGPYAICMKEDKSIIDVKRINIPMDAKEGDILGIEEPTITTEKTKKEESYICIDDIILYI